VAPDVPDEFGEKARRLDELTKTVNEMKRLGLKIPQDVKRELDELNQIWSKARIFRRFISRPGSLKITVPTQDGMTVISWKVEKASQSLGNTIKGLHAHLGETMGIIMSFDNAVSLRDAVVQARAEGKREAPQGKAPSKEVRVRTSRPIFTRRRSPTASERRT
jgi:Ni,Fe-hydrogenase III large subunit